MKRGTFFCDVELADPFLLKTGLNELVRWAEGFDGEGQVWHFRGRGNTQKRRVYAPEQGEK